MRVYLAAPYPSRDVLREYANDLFHIGFQVTSSWLLEEHEISPGTSGAAVDLPDDQVDKHALDDMADIDRSELLVLFTENVVQGPSGGGRHVETGYALAKGMPIIVVGDPENVFHRLQDGRVVRVADWHDAVLELSRRLVDKLRHTPRSAEAAVMAR